MERIVNFTKEDTNEEKILKLLNEDLQDPNPIHKTKGEVNHIMPGMGYLVMIQPYITKPVIGIETKFIKPRFWPFGFQAHIESQNGATNIKFYDDNEKLCTLTLTHNENRKDYFRDAYRIGSKLMAQLRRDEEFKEGYFPVYIRQTMTFSKDYSHSDEFIADRPSEKRIKRTLINLLS